MHSNVSGGFVHVSARNAEFSEEPTRTCRTDQVDDTFCVGICLSLNLGHHVAARPEFESAPSSIESEHFCNAWREVGVIQFFVYHSPFVKQLIQFSDERTKETNGVEKSSLVEPVVH